VIKAYLHTWVLFGAIVVMVVISTMTCEVLALQPAAK